MLTRRLVELRNKHNLTQENIAEILQVSRTTYAMYEQGRREMDYNSLVKLADFYKVSLDYLFGRTDIPILPECYPEDEIEFMTKTLEIYRNMKKSLVYECFL